MPEKANCGVAVAGWGETGPLAEDPRSIPEMVLEAVEAALADAAIGYDDIGAAVTASVDLWDGLTASNIAVTEVVGAVMKPETRIAGDGLAAALHAACQIRAGAYQTVLVVAHAKASMSPHQALTQWAMDPVHLQPLGVDFLISAGLQARALADNDPQAEVRWADTVAERRAAAPQCLTPVRSAAEILASPVAASPLREGMCAPLGDGACAVVLRAETGKAKNGAIRLTGIGHDLAPHALGDRDLTRWDGLARACARAYEDAGITDPAAAIDLAEPSCFYAHEEELFARAAGIGDRAARSPSGGLFGGTAPVVAGLSRLAAAAAHMRGDESCRAALAHGAWGPAGQGQAVAVLERGRR